MPGLGRLEPGGPADLADFRGTPPGTSPARLPGGGRRRRAALRREALLGAAARQREHFDRAPYAPLFEAAARAAIAATSTD